MNAERTPRVWPRRMLRAAGIALVVMVAVIVARALYAFRDRDPSAAFTLQISDEAWRQNPRPLRVGFGRAKITPDLSDPRRPVYLAGFAQNRKATAVHDDLWALACVIDDGHHRLGIAALDAIGLFHEAVTEIRRRLRTGDLIDYAIVCTTHNHNTPDLMGLWGPHPLKTGVDPQYLEQVIAATVRALGDAATALEPAQVAFHELAVPTEGMVTDTRKPFVFDPDLRVMHFTRPANGTTLGTVVTWANHPETLWSRNTEITSDFCGHFRDAVEQGVTLEGRTVLAGLGGTHLFINGALGGLITTPASVTVTNPFTGVALDRPSHDKARALGWQLAARLVPVLAQAAPATNRVPLTIRAHTLEIPLDNWAFLAAPFLGLLDRGHASWMNLRTEVALVTLGDASIACVPGEIYPELVNGGIERAPGGDFDCDPVEVPVLREMMPGRVKFVFGLANDEIGYIIPKSEWDRKPPYLYGAERGVYGEINSVGPECAPTLHAAFRELTAPPPAMIERRARRTVPSR
ncbi:MAG: hypothetical protein IPM17_15825 [Verrucomicrobia bacterium]|nr:hypothetical protein [Verrucomicrobiota bacterium]